MPMFSRRATAALAAGLFLPDGARAQAFPDRAVRLIMPYGPGSEPDLLGRQLAQGMAPVLGQPVVVENKAGGSSMIGAEAVANARPDGYTLLFGGSTVFAANPNLFSRTPYRPDQFQPITLLMRGRILLYANPAAGFTSVQDLVARAKAAREPMRFGSTGRGNGTHLSAEQFRVQAGVDVTDVAYRTTVEMQQGLMRGDIDFAFDSVGPYLALVRDGRIKALGTAGARRIGVLADLPTFTEQGFPDLGMPYWYGLYAPAGLPGPVLARLHQAAVAAMSDPALLARAEQQGATIETQDVATFVAMNQSEFARWGQLIGALGVRLD
ncbi:Bug family tripartite tricarboxylate transporter substrate binding protein [Humitalea sp. 24SJ18S-53]|uniref:Bug family tripartite tricarboxylate transporter substrate binding protein n=1 Tax=Humitalea sp. 24SJ18S-53 TaxID=3422307 RepID=UPI003D678AD6